MAKWTKRKTKFDQDGSRLGEWGNTLNLDRVERCFVCVFFRRMMNILVKMVYVTQGWPHCSA